MDQTSARGGRHGYCFPFRRDSLLVPAARRYKQRVLLVMRLGIEEDELDPSNLPRANPRSRVSDVFSGGNATGTQTQRGLRAS
jgi:hypothetical protein